MFRFLSKFNFATRIYAMSFLLGGFVVFTCFFSVFAMNNVNKGYLEAESLIENTQRFTALEAHLSSFSRSLYAFEVNPQSLAQKENVEQSFQDFQLKIENLSTTFKSLELQTKYQDVLSSVQGEYALEMKEMFSLFERSLKVSQAVEALSESITKDIKALIQETSLPSASLALNALNEQFQLVLTVTKDLRIKEPQTQQTLKKEFLALKQERNSAEKAEMINAPKLKALFNAMVTLEEETNRKIKIQTALDEKITLVASFIISTSENLKEILDLMNRSSFELLRKADKTKIFFQKIFVFLAAFAGLFATVLAFLCLFGIKYPLSRLIKNAQDMARGDANVLIHFTEREDEVGELAKALAGVLVKLKTNPLVVQESLVERKNETFGSVAAYVPLGAASDIGTSLKTPQNQASDTVTYFGQGVGVDSESQLCQMLALMMHTTAASNKMTKETIKDFSVCRAELKQINKKIKKIEKDILKLQSKSEEKTLYNLLEDTRLCVDTLSVFASYAQEILTLKNTQINTSDYAINLLEQTQHFVEKLFNWGDDADVLTKNIAAICSETKILALNASIEAVKCGDKAKTFSALSSDIRQKIQKTTENSNTLTAEVLNLKQDLMDFANVMKNLGASVEAIKEGFEQNHPIEEEQSQRLSHVSKKLETMSQSLETKIGEELEKNLVEKALVLDIEEVKETPNEILEKIESVQKTLKAFDESLPTYEEDEILEK